MAEMTADVSCPCNVEWAEGKGQMANGKLLLNR